MTGLSSWLPLAVGVVLGAGMGAAVAWLWAAARERRRGEEHADRLRGELAESARARAVAETQAAELRGSLDDKRALLAVAETRLGDTFRALAADALAANNQGFLTLAGEKLSAARRETDAALDARQNAIDALVKPVRESLDKVDGRIRDLERERGHAYGQLTTLVRQLAETQEGLRAETGNLARALRAPAVRGRWGEIQLKRVVEIAGMVEHCDFGQQQTLTSDEGTRLRPDMVVRLPGGRHVVVDAKVPLDAYLDALETTDETARRERIAAHAAQVRSHVFKLGAKGYWAALDDTPEFVVMFLPSEAMYSAALEAAPSLIEDGVARRVLIATPTTLIALLQTVQFGWRQERLADSAREISEQGRVLHERLATLVEHWSRLGGALGRATEHFNAAVASFDTRVLPAVRKLEEMGGGGAKAVNDLATVDTRPRPLLPVEDAALPRTEPAGNC